MPVNMKRMISRELFSLIEEKGIDKLNVQMLSSKCGISRQAFYYHFKDIADVIDWTFQNILQELTTKASKHAHLKDALQDYLDIAISNKPILLRICESTHYYDLEKRLCQYTFLFLCSIPADRWTGTLKQRGRREQYLAFLSPALVSYSFTFLQQPPYDAKKSAQQLVHLFLPESAL